MRWKRLLREHETFRPTEQFIVAQQELFTRHQLSMANHAIEAVHVEKQLPSAHNQIDWLEGGSASLATARVQTDVVVSAQDLPVAHKCRTGTFVQRDRTLGTLQAILMELQVRMHTQNVLVRDWLCTLGAHWHLPLLQLQRFRCCLIELLRFGAWLRLRCLERCLHRFEVELL